MTNTTMGEKEMKGKRKNEIKLEFVKRKKGLIKRGNIKRRRRRRRERYSQEDEEEGFPLMLFSKGEKKENK